MPNPEIHRKVTEQDDPERCQGVLQGSGQCTNAKIAGSNYCIRHGGWAAAGQANNEGLRNYRLGVWKQRINEFADNPQAKSLREEIGITRLQLESILNRCPDDSSLLSYSDRIAKLVDQIEKLVCSCQKLEEKTGALIDKTQLLTISDSIVKVIADFIKEPDDLDMIGLRILQIIAQGTTSHGDAPIISRVR